MRTTILAAASVAVLALAGCAGQPAASHSPEPEWDVPCASLEGAVAAEDFTDVELPCLTTPTTHGVGPTDGRPLVLSLWASWCGPCVTEAPEVEEFHQRTADEIDVIGVNTQDTRDKARFFAQDFEWTFPSLYDERGDVMRGQGIVALPAIFFINADGTTATVLTAADLTAEDLVAAAEEHFGVTG